MLTHNRNTDFVDSHGFFPSSNLWNYCVVNDAFLMLFPLHKIQIVPLQIQTKDLLYKISNTHDNPFFILFKVHFKSPQTAKQAYTCINLRGHCLLTAHKGPLLFKGEDL